MKRSEIQAALALNDRKHVQDAYLRPAIESGLVEMTVPDKPLSSRQRYRLTAAGAVLALERKSGAKAR